MNYKIDMNKYRDIYPSFPAHLQELVQGVLIDVAHKGIVNHIQKDMLLDLEFLIKNDGANKFDIDGVREEDVITDEVREKTVLGMYDFVDTEKEPDSRRRAFWTLIHQVNQEMVKDVGNAQVDLNLIVPNHFISILEQSVAFISAADERVGGVEEFKGERVTYEGRLQDSKFSIYSIEKPDCIYIALKDGRYTMIRIK